MARSQLLIDVVNERVSIDNILLRLKVILSDLQNESIMSWVNGELQGYSKNEEVPKYRVLKGTALGTYLVNYQTQYTNAPVPLKFLIPDDLIDKLETVYVRDSLSAIQNVLNGENRENYGSIIPTDLCHSISKDEIQIAGMRVSIASTLLDGILSNVKSKLVDIVMELEKQFDNLDELDIKTQIEVSSSKKEKVIYNIEQIIYEGSINIGDKNKIAKSKLGHFWSREK